MTRTSDVLVTGARRRVRDACGLRNLRAQEIRLVSPHEQSPRSRIHSLARRLRRRARTRISRIRSASAANRCTNGSSRPARSGRHSARTAARPASTTISPRAAFRTSAPGSSAATCSGRCAAPGRTTPGRAGGATTRPIMCRCSCSRITRARRSTMAGGTTFHFVTDGIEAALAQREGGGARPRRPHRRRRGDDPAYLQRRADRRDALRDLAGAARRRRGAVRRPRPADSSATSAREHVPTAEGDACGAHEAGVVRRIRLFRAGPLVGRG